MLVWKEYLGKELACNDDYGGGGHEEGRNTKGQREAAVLSKALLLPEDGGDEGAEEGAAVDAEVEDGEEGLQLQSLLRQLELVPSQKHQNLFFYLLKGQGHKIWFG